MPKSSKSSSRKPKAKTTRAKKTAPPKAPVQWSPEYEEYLERYTEFGRGRPRLSPEEFEQYDDELLDLLDLSGGKLDDEQVIRIQELEYLLIDSENNI